MSHRLALALFLLCALACDGGSTDGNGGNGSHDPDQDVPQREVVVNNVTEVETLDPGRMQGVPEHRIAMSLFEGLCVYDPQTNEGRPGVAESWDISEDGRTYTFHLRENAQWSDGRPVTAADFRYSWLRVLHPDFPTVYAELIFKFVEGAQGYREGTTSNPDDVRVRAIDDHTLEVRLLAPTPFFPQLLCHMTFFPVPQWCVEEHGEDWTKPGKMVTNGAYMLTEREINNFILVERNPHYWNRANIAIPAIRWLPVNDLVTSLTMYEQGQTDWMTDIPLEQIDRLMTRDDCRIATYLGTYYYQFNTTVEPLDDPRVRRALALAVDRDRLCRNVLRAGQRPAHHYVPPLFPPYESAVFAGADMQANIAEARSLLADAGFAGGQGFPRLRILYNTLEQHRVIAAFIQEQWRQNLGVEIDLENTEWNTYLQRRNSMDYEIARAGWIGDFGDPMTFLDMWITDGGHNNTGFADPEYDRLIFGALSEADVDRRRAMMADAERILMDELPIMPLYFYVSKNMVHRSLDAYFDTPLDQHPLNAMRWGRGTPHD